MNLEKLEAELNRIKDENIREFTRKCLTKAPAHFWYRPASSTGKYHFKDENREGGLVLHTKRVFEVACILVETWPRPVNGDIVMSAALLHDICKYGSSYSASRFTLNDHPKLASDFILRIDPNQIEIAEAVRCHTGKWGGVNLDGLRDETLLVHLADFIATNYSGEE